MTFIMAKPKGSFLSRLPNGDLLNMVIWPGKSDPQAEIIAVEVRRYRSDTEWETIGRLAVYRDQKGKFILLPEKKSN
jgi:hypothetical protein